MSGLQSAKRLQKRNTNIIRIIRFAWENCIRVYARVLNCLLLFAPEKFILAPAKESSQGVRPARLACTLKDPDA